MVVLLLMICWPLAELLAAIAVAQLIGVLPTLLLLALSLPFGFWVLREQGRGAWRRLSAAVAAGRSPGNHVIDGALIVAGAGLLIVPGFITDVLGLLLLVGPVRALARRGIARHARSRFVVRATSFGSGRRPYDVDSTATDVDGAQLPR
jgi:UPF0716 protein FxsA